MVETDKKTEQAAKRFFLVSYTATNRIMNQSVFTNILLATGGTYLNARMFNKHIAKIGKFVNPVILAITELSEQDANDFAKEV